MRVLHFHIHTCGLSEETLTEEIMIFRPIHTEAKSFSLEDLERAGISTVSGLLERIKEDDTARQVLGEWGLEQLSVETLYIHQADCLLGLREDKPLCALFDYFRAETLELDFFMVGGASIHNETSYRFTVHPREEIHRNMPHVHVSKGDVEIRYSLETLQPIDPLVNPHKRDNKKIILPFLEKNQNRLMDFWRYYLDGYTSPQLTQEGQQFYPES